MAIAALWGTTSGYQDYYHSVLIEKTDGNVMVVKRELFDELYYEIRPFTVALKEDCIEYAINDPMIHLQDQPDWYISAVNDEVIYERCGMDMFYSEEGEEIPMTPGSVIMLNFKGKLRYMEFEEFIKYYELQGSEFIES